VTVKDAGQQTAIPPDTLYFGTSSDAATAILIDGLTPQPHAYVHLSADPITARMQGAKLGKPVVFTVYARTAYDEGQPFWIKDDGVWLTDALPSDFLYLPPIRGAE
jgi:putative RNA 2'-phosphotransferase